MIARHRPKSVFRPADVERVRERFQTILKNVSEKPLVEVKAAKPVVDVKPAKPVIGAKPPVAAPARKSALPAPSARPRKRA